MRYLILVFLIMQSVSGYSQFFVGDSTEFAESILEKNKIKFTKSKLTATTSRISWIVDNEYQKILVYNTKNTITRQTLIPEGENGVNEFVRWFNEDFVVI
mgnify:CR=1 FL=1